MAFVFSYSCLHYTTRSQLFSFFFKIDRAGIDAEMLARRLCFRIVKDMAEMRFAFAAENFGAMHSHAHIIEKFHAAGYSVLEARPARKARRLRDVFRIGRKELVAADFAIVFALRLLVPVFARERRFS